MKKSSGTNKPCALLWDESFLWGIMSFKALKTSGLQFDFVRAEDIRNGILNNYKMLFVPGGWASNKIKSLGEKGVEEIRRFVQSGGNYLGFCGGAGLATLDGIGLLNIKRVPTKDRVPSFSGQASFDLAKHPIWGDNTGLVGPIFHVWWPSQFSIADTSINILSKYDRALPDSFSSDLNVGDIMKSHGNWESLEQAYGINLDPFRLSGQPAVVEGNFGNGKVILSLIHFDTPEDKNGAVVLKNLWKYLAGVVTISCDKIKMPDQENTAHFDFGVSELLTAVDELIACGERNFLWFWRNPVLLQWRRGIRGLEYCTLYGMIKTVAEYSHIMIDDIVLFRRQVNSVIELLLPFKEKAERLLLLEKKALHDGHRITYEKSDDSEIMQLRQELFANSKSYGGMFKKLLDRIDSVLFGLLRTA